MKKLFLLLISIFILVNCVDSSSQHFARGKFFYEKELYEDAVREFHSVLQNDSNNADAYYHLALSYARLGWQDYAIESAKKAFQLRPSSERYKLIQILKKK